MHFQYGIYYSPVPAAFIRVLTPMPTPPPLPQHQFEADELELGKSVRGLLA